MKRNSDVLCQITKDKLRWKGTKVGRCISEPEMCNYIRRENQSHKGGVSS